MDTLQAIEIPCGQGSGLNSLTSLGNFPITDLKVADTVTFENSTLAKERGIAKINTVAISGSPPLVGLWDYWPSFNTQIPIAATGDGRIVSFGSSGIITTLATGLSGTQLITFAEALGGSSTRKLFAFTGSDTPLVTPDGVNMAPMALPAAGWGGTNQPIAGVFHSNRMWCFGNASTPHMIYFSRLGNQEDFQTLTGADVAGTFNVYPGEGARIIGACDFAGILYIFKYPRGIYWLNDSNPTMANWSMTRLTMGVGMAGVLAGAQVDNDYVFLTPGGMLSSLMAVQQYGLAASVQTSSILPTNLMTYMQQNLQTSQVANAVAVYYAYKREWHLAFAQSGFTYNNRRLILDLRNPASPMLRTSSRDICNAMALMIDSNGISRPIIGDNAGFVRMLDNPVYNVDGNPYTGRFQTGDIPLIDNGKRRANLFQLEIVYQPTGPYTLYIDVYRDGTYSQTVSFSMAGASTGGQLDSFKLGTSVLGGVGGTLNAKRMISGDCRRVSFVGYNGDLNGSFSISSMKVYFTEGSMRI